MAAKENRVWLKVEDQDEWVPCICGESRNGTVKLKRLYAPTGTSRDVQLPDAEAKLREAQGDLEAASSDLVWLPDIHESSMLHNLRLRCTPPSRSPAPSARPWAEGAS